MGSIFETAQAVREMLETDIPLIKAAVDAINLEIGTDNSENIADIKKAVEVDIPATLGTPVDTNMSVDIANIQAVVDDIKNEVISVPTKNSASNLTTSEVVGNKEDDEDGDSLYSAAYILKRHAHSRTRTYPYLAAGIGLTAHNSALTMGNIVEITPVVANEVNTLTITHACDNAGNITIDLNGEKFVKPIGIGDINSVAEQLRGMLFEAKEGGPWVVTGASADVIFTRGGLSTTGVLSNLGATGVTGSFVKTNTGAGIQKPFDIHGLQVGLMGNQDTYIVTLYAGLAGYEERILSRRITTTNNNQAGGEIAVGSNLLPANTRISASLASLAGGASKTAVISFSYHLY